MHFLENAEKMISIPSTSRNGNEEIALFLQEKMKKIGLKVLLQNVVHSVPGVSKRQFNVIGILGEPLVDRTTKKGLLLLNHMDTFEPVLTPEQAKQDQYEPFKLGIDGTFLQGLGVADAKLDLLCKLKALEHYRDRRLKMPVYLVGTCGSKVGFLGARFLIQSLVVNPKYVLVGGPTKLKIAATQSGNAKFGINIRFSQKQRDPKKFTSQIKIQIHEQSENALFTLVRILNKFKEANQEFQVARIFGGSFSDRIPFRAAAEIYVQEEHADEFRKICETLESGSVFFERGTCVGMGLSFVPQNVLNAIERIFNFLKAEENLKAIPTLISSTPEFIEIKFDAYFDHEQALTGFTQKAKAELGEDLAHLARERVFWPYELKMQGEFFQGVQKLSEDIKMSLDPYMHLPPTEAGLFQHEGFETLTIGPGEVTKGQNHEKVSAEALDQAIFFYDRLIERFCL